MIDIDKELKRLKIEQELVREISQVSKDINQLLADISVNTNSLSKSKEIRKTLELKFKVLNSRLEHWKGKKDG